MPPFFSNQNNNDKLSNGLTTPAQAIDAANKFDALGISLVAVIDIDPNIPAVGDQRGHVLKLINGQVTNAAAFLANYANALRNPARLKDAFLPLGQMAPSGPLGVTGPDWNTTESEFREAGNLAAGVAEYSAITPGGGYISDSSTDVQAIGGTSFPGPIQVGQLPKSANGKQNFVHVFTPPANSGAAQPVVNARLILEGYKAAGDAGVKAAIAGRLVPKGTTFED